jgi:DNA polymerase III delta prime subunit
MNFGVNFGVNFKKKTNKKASVTTSLSELILDTGEGFYDCLTTQFMSDEEFPQQMWIVVKEMDNIDRRTSPITLTFIEEIFRKMFKKVSRVKVLFDRFNKPRLIVYHVEDLTTFREVEEFRKNKKSDHCNIQ